MSEAWEEITFNSFMDSRQNSLFAGPPHFKALSIPSWIQVMDGVDPARVRDIVFQFLHGFKPQWFYAVFIYCVKNFQFLHGFKGR